MIRFLLISLILLLGTGVAWADPLYPEDKGTYDTLLAQAKEKKLPVVLDFYADWCPPCQAMSVVMHGVEKKYQEKVVFIPINIDREESRSFARLYQVTSIPTLIFLDRSQQPKGRMIGLMAALMVEGELQNISK